MSVSRKDYELLAETIRNSGFDFKSNTRHAAFAGYMAFKLSQDNPRFDAERFIMAAMPTTFVGTRHANQWERVSSQWSGTGTSGTYNV